MKYCPLFALSTHSTRMHMIPFTIKFTKKADYPGETTHPSLENSTNDITPATRPLHLHPEVIPQQFQSILLFYRSVNSSVTKRGRTRAAITETKPQGDGWGWGAGGSAPLVTDEKFFEQHRSPAAGGCQRDRRARGIEISSPHIEHLKQKLGRRKPS